MNDLPELPFEQVLSYLNLEDRLKARAVSRRWYHKINCFKVNTLCYSNRKRDFIWGKNRWVRWSFAKNFINSNRFTSFFNTFGQTILSNLNHLRLCDLVLSEEDPTAFLRILNSFSQLERLDIIRVQDLQSEFKLDLPMLTSIQVEGVEGIEKLTLGAPRLREVKIQDCFQTDLRVKIVHGESVERLHVDYWLYTEVKNLKNLRYLYVDYLPSVDPTLLSSLPKLKEFHMKDPEDVSEMFEQKQRSDRADLKIYLKGLLLNGPDDTAINALRGSSWLVCLAENRSRMADELPFYRFLYYSNIEGITPGLEVNLLKVFTDLNSVIVNRPVKDIERFLNLLKNCENISELWFECDHPQDLFDRLPEHCAVQELILWDRPSDLDFLFRLKHLIHLDIDWTMDSETVRRAFEQLPVLVSFKFRYDRKSVSIEIGHPKQFQVSVVFMEKTTFYNLNAAIEFIFGKEKSSRPN